MRIPVEYKRGTPEQRFWPKVSKSEDKDGCWLWTAGKNAKGYGTFSISHGKAVLAHRWAWIDARGPVPAGLELDHVCRHKDCIRPDHLETVTHAENVRRGLKGVLFTHCKYGHLVSGDNLILTSNGHRQCRTCKNTRAAGYRLAMKKPPRTHCRQGHPYSGDNLYPNPQGYRVCRECKLAKYRRSGARKQAKIVQARKTAAL